MHTKSSRDESTFPGFNSRGMITFHKDLKRRFLSAIGMLEGPCVCCLKWNGDLDALSGNKGRFPRVGLNVGSSFLSHYEGMTEFPVDTLEKALAPRLISTGCLTTL